MEINYRNGFLFGVKLLKKKIVVKRLRLFHNPPPKYSFYELLRQVYLSLQIEGVRSLRSTSILVWGVLRELVIYLGSILAWLTVCCDAGSLFIFGKS